MRFTVPDAPAERAAIVDGIPAVPVALEPGAYIDIGGVSAVYAIDNVVCIEKRDVVFRFTCATRDVAAQHVTTIAIRAGR